jgi:hypothetical protein
MIDRLSEEPDVTGEEPEPKPEPALEVVFTVDGGVYGLDEGRATILGEKLRRAAAGQLGERGYRTGALAVANGIESVLVGASDAPIELTGDAPEAVFHYLDVATTPPSAPEFPLYRAVRRAHYRVQGND